MMLRKAPALIQPSLVDGTQDTQAKIVHDVEKSS